MSALFVDTSALVRRYVDEPGHDLVVEAMAGEDPWVASALARTETMITLHQLATGPRQQARLWSGFRDDWDAFAVVPVDERCLARAVEIGSQFIPRPLRYLTFDRHQIPAAASLGFEVISPTA